ncbi:MAG: hypothetical protein WB810_03755 [Candidatus Cybelea sp.]
MRLFQGILFAAVAVVIVSPNAAIAHGYNGSSMVMIAPESHSYTGNWPATVTKSQHSNGTYCLTLTQNGRNSGSGSLVLPGGSKLSFGTFQIFNHTLVVTFEAQGYGQNAGLVFVGSAGRGNLGQGVFDDVYGGEAFDEGALAFGTKGGC